MEDFRVRERSVWQLRFAGLLKMVLMDSPFSPRRGNICGDAVAKGESRCCDSVYLRVVSMPVGGDIQ